MAPLARAAGAERAAPTVYTVELIVFRNMSGSGGPEDWSAKAVARGPESPKQPVVTGRFVQSSRRRSSSSRTSPQNCRTPLTINLSRISPGSRPRAPGARAPGSRWRNSQVRCPASPASSISNAALPAPRHVAQLPDVESAGRTRRAARHGLQPHRITSRAVRTLSYFDHPAFGVIALVTPGNAATGGR